MNRRMILLMARNFTADYYISTALGNDANDGKTKATAFKHHPWDLAATGTADATVLTAGQKVAYRQEQYYGVYLSTPGGAAPATPITTTAHPHWGTGGVILSGAIDPSTLTWTVDGGSYKATLAVQPTYVVYNTTPLTFATGHGNTVDLNEFDWVANELFVNVGEDPSIGTLKASNKAYVILVYKSNLLFSNLTLELANGAGNIFTSSVNDITIDNCVSRWTNSNGFYLYEGARSVVKNSTVYTINAVGINALTTTVTEVYGNTVYDCDTDGIKMGGTDCVCHHNIARNNYRYGISLTNSITSSAYQNTVYENGHGYYGHSGAGAGIVINATSIGNRVYKNHVYDSFRGIYHSVAAGACGNKIYYNLVRNSTVNSIDSDYDPGTTNPVEVYNNTVIHIPSASNTPQYTGHGIDTQLNGKMMKIANNLMVIGVVGNNCNGIDLVTGGGGFVYAWIDYNLYFDDSDSGGLGHIGALGAQYTDMALWQAALQADAKVFDMGGNAGAGEANGVYGDALFVDAAGGDYHLVVGSPAIDAGIDVGLTEDFDDNPVGNPPCIGCFEF